MFRKFALIVVLSFNFFGTAMAADQKSQTILNEYSRLFNLVSQMEPEYNVGGYMNGKNMGNVEILWKFARSEADFDVIRIYNAGPTPQQSFAVSYYRGTHILEGYNVVRRFIGPVVTGWRGDTMDLATGNYLGIQGVRAPLLSGEAKNILRRFGIKLSLGDNHRARFVNQVNGSASCGHLLD